MKWLSFLAGVATGLLLAQRATRPAAAAGDNAAANTGERDYPTHAPPRTDEELRERIRARIGRTIGNPDAIQVEVAGGLVTLRGQVQARDSVLLMTEVESTAGVQSVQNQLEIQGALDEVVPPMTVDSPAVRSGEARSSQVS